MKYKDLSTEDLAQALEVCARPKSPRCSSCPIFGHGDHNCTTHIMQEAAKRLMEKDRVKVIRCRDCKYYRQRRETFGDCRQGDDWREVYPDDFCSYGERKENGE